MYQYRNLFVDTNSLNIIDVRLTMKSDKMLFDCLMSRNRGFSFNFLATMSVSTLGSKVMGIC